MDVETIRDLETLQAYVRDGGRPRLLFFWGHQPPRGAEIGKQCLSQWWPAELTVDGVRYPSAEHYMMAEKARLFGDEEALAQVLRAGHPKEAKEAGKLVRGYDEAAWAAARFGAVVRGNVAKFGQNPQLGAFLAGTGSRVLVEASPLDRIWGIGLAEDDPKAQDPRQWQGLNLLGFALMEARSLLARAGG